MKESAYHFRARQIVCLIRRFSAASCGEHAIRFIRSVNVSEGGYVWLGVMLFEWTIALDSKARQQMTYRDFRKIMNRMIALQNYTKGPGECQTATAWLRRISYQQFPYQRRISSFDIGRQLMLFGQDGEAAQLGRLLADAAGIQIRDFLMLCVALLTHLFVEKQFSFSLSWFQPLRASITSGAIERFIEILTFDGRFQEPNHESGYYENSQLFRKPLFRVKAANGIWVYEYLHVAHGGEALSNFVYDTLKARDANRFMGEFGDCFSRYLGNYLSKTVEDLLTERDLKERYGLASSKVVDFLVCEEHSAILIEAKAIEANSTMRSTASGTTLGQRFRDTVLKAITQARATAEGVSLSDPDFRDEMFLIVVTYKQLYLATGEIIRECIDPQILEKYEAECAGSRILPFDNIFVFSVDEFERLIAAVDQKKTTITSFLREVKDRQKAFAGRRFVIGQHLDRLGYLDYPQALVAVATSAFEEIESIFTNPTSASSVK